MITQNMLTKTWECKYFLVLLGVNTLLGLVIAFYPSKKFTAAKPIYPQENFNIPEPNIPILRKYIAGTDKILFHKMTCKMVEELTATTIFNTREEAIKADKEPCPACEP